MHKNYRKDVDKKIAFIRKAAKGFLKIDKFGKDMKYLYHDIKPTKRGDSVIARIYQPSTTASICVPIPTKVVEDQTKVKLRYRKTERG